MNVNIDTTPPGLSQAPDTASHRISQATTWWPFSRALGPFPVGIPCAGSQHPPCLLAASSRACTKSCFLKFVLICSVCLFVPLQLCLKLHCHSLKHSHCLLLPSKPILSTPQPSHTPSVDGRHLGVPKQGPAFLLMILDGHKMIHEMSWSRGSFLVG